MGDAIDRSVVDDFGIGVLGIVADQRPIFSTGTAIWAAREDGTLLHHRVERSFRELFQRLSER